MFGTTTSAVLQHQPSMTTTMLSLSSKRHHYLYNQQACENAFSKSKRHRSSTSNRHPPQQQQQQQQQLVTSASAYERRYVSTTASSSSFPCTKSMMCDLLTDDESIKWASAKAVVMELGFDDDEADRVMQKGFGWAKQDYWRNEKVKEIPDMDEIEKRIQFIESLGVARDKIDVIVSKFPEILAMDIDGVMKPAVEHVEKNFFMKRGTTAFAKYVIRVPQALGNTIDCEGTCVGDCNRCWVRV